MTYLVCEHKADSIAYSWPVVAAMGVDLQTDHASASGWVRHPSDDRSTLVRERGGFGLGVTAAAFFQGDASMSGVVLISR